MDIKTFDTLKLGDNVYEITKSGIIRTYWLRGKWNGKFFLEDKVGGKSQIVRFRLDANTSKTVSTQVKAERLISKGNMVEETMFLFADGTEAYLSQAYDVLQGIEQSQQTEKQEKDLFSKLKSQKVNVNQK